MQTVYPTVYVPRMQQVTTIKGSELTLNVDWTGAEGELEETVDNCSWVAKGGISVSAPTFAASVASVLVSANETGVAMLECQAFFDDGQVRKQQYEISVLPNVIQ